MAIRTPKLGTLIVAMGCVLAAPALLGQADALAGSCSATESADMTRLRGELAKLSAKNAHAGVLRTFGQMLDLNKAQKCELKAEDYKVAGGSARSTGDIANAVTWLTSGGASVDVADLKARFGQVEIKEKAGELAKDGGMPFPPDERAALQAAIDAVKSGGKFSGYLPVGKYTLGAKTFEVKTTGVTKV